MFWAIMLTLEIARAYVFCFEILRSNIRKSCFLPSSLIYIVSLLVIITLRPSADNKFNSNFILICTLVITVLLVGKRKLFLPLLYWTVSTLAETIVYGAIIALKTAVKGTEIFDTNAVELISSFSVLIIFCIAALILRKFLTYPPISILNAGSLTVLIIGSFSCTLDILSMQEIMTCQDYNGKYSLISILACCVTGIVFVVVCCSLILSDSLKRKYKIRYEISRRIAEEEESRCKLIIQKNAETMKLRHDMKNHIFCMSHLFHSARYEELGQYLCSLGNDISRLSVPVKTGNHLFNAIIADLDAAYPDVQTEITGILPEKLTIRDIDLCSIYFNLLKNAYEAVDRLPHDIPHKISFEIKAYKNYFFITISNPVAECVKITNNLVTTTKPDASAHGYGLKSASDAIKRLDGSLHISCSDKIFTVETMVPLTITEYDCSG